MRYAQRVKTVDAVQWTGDNRQEVRDFLAGWLSEEMGPYFNREEDPNDEFNTCTFYYGEDIEVDPGVWIMFDGDVLKLCSDRWFRKRFRRIGP